MTFLEWCQQSALSELVRKEAWTIPAIEILHLSGVILVFGSTLIINLRLLGWILASEPSSVIAADLARRTRLGLILLVVTGPLLFFAMPMKLFETPDFSVKLALVAVAITYHLAVHRKRMLAAESSRGLKISAGISMALWLAAILAGLEVGSFT
jgi:hypothetical protein